jgi:hypothetical protein
MLSTVSAVFAKSSVVWSTLFCVLTNKSIKSKIFICNKNKNLNKNRYGTNGHARSKYGHRLRSRSKYDHRSRSRPKYGHGTKWHGTVQYRANGQVHAPARNFHCINNKCNNINLTLNHDYDHDQSTDMVRIATARYSTVRIVTSRASTKLTLYQINNFYT